MKLGLFFIGFLGCFAQANAQVGIGTNDPKATLDVVAQNSTTGIDGILIPRVSRDRAMNMVGVQNSTMIYVNDVTGYDGTDTSSKASLIDQTGFYLYKAIIGKWIKLPDYDQVTEIVSDNSYWKAQASSTTSPKNTKLSKSSNLDVLVGTNIFQKGKVGIGYSAEAEVNFEDNPTLKQLEVGGDFRTVKWVDSEDKTDPFTGVKYTLAPQFYGIETNSVALPDYLATRGNVMYSASTKDLKAFSDYNKIFDGNMVLQSEDKFNILSKKGKASEGDGSKIYQYTASSLGGFEFISTMKFTPSYSNKSKERSFTSESFYVTDGDNRNIRFGLDFIKNKFFVGDNSDFVDSYGNSIKGEGYFFPNKRGTVGQTLRLADSDGNLEWAASSATNASPQFFYMPSVVLPTVSTDSRVVDTTNTSYTYNTATGVYTVNLYDLYNNQFRIPIAKSSTTATLDGFVAVKTAYDYFVTYADSNVFENITVSTDGILTYQVKTNSIIRTGSFMNIVLKVK